MRRPLVLLVLAAAGGIVLHAGQAAPAVNATKCARYASPSGDDVAAGSSAAPFKTVGKLAASLAPGQIGCLAAGATFDEQIVISARGAGGRPIRLGTAPGGRRAVIRGTVRFEQSSQFFVLERVVIQGTSTRDVEQAHVILSGYGNALVRNDISAAPGKDNSCVALHHARQARVDSNTIHDCGHGALYGAGVVASVSVAGKIENNFIYSNSGDGVVLAPNAQLTNVTRNVLFGNDAGVYFGGGLKAASSDNKVTKNIISTSARFSIHGSYRAGEPIGRKNVVSGNCFWAAGQAQIAGVVGFTVTRSNFTANPTFADPPRSFFFRQKGRCYPLRPLSFRQEPAPESSPAKPKAYPALLASLTYAAASVPARGEVRLGDLGVKDVSRGAQVRFWCTSGCATTETLKASETIVASRSFRSRTFKGRVVIAVAVAKPGYVGWFRQLTLAPTAVTATEGGRMCLAPGKLTGPRPCSSFRIRK